MRKILGLGLVMLYSLHSHSQTEFMNQGGKTALEKGAFQINSGTGYSNWGLPIYGGIEYAFNEDITCGGVVSYRSYAEGFLNVKWKHEIISFIAIANMHVNRLLKFKENVDLYGGVSLGFNSWNTKTNDFNPGNASYKGARKSGVHVGGQAGARYFFNRVFGIHGEVMAGSFIGMHAGLTFRIQ